MTSIPNYIMKKNNTLGIKSKKKSIPININSNPTPGKFLFSNQINNIASSYLSMGQKIQTNKNLKTSKLIHVILQIVKKQSRQIHQFQVQYQIILKIIIGAKSILSILIIILISIIILAQTIMNLKAQKKIIIIIIILSLIQEIKDNCLLYLILIYLIMM